MVAIEHQYVAFFAAAACGLVAWALLRRTSKPLAIVIGLVTAGSVFGAVSPWLQKPSDPPASSRSESPSSDWTETIELAQLSPIRPLQVSDSGYVTSQSCVECHPRKHATWFASYHRRMTQVATPTAVLGNFDNVQVATQGRTYQLRRHNDVCWVQMDDPQYPVGAVPRIEVPIVLTTGSHHMQVYWYGTGDGRTLGQLPVAFLNETKQWVPRDAAFLQAPTPFGSEHGRWNQTCINCHTTHGQPRPTGVGVWDSQVGEFGISCEACHGPASDHVAFHRGAANGNARVDSIVNPAKLPHDRATEVCGQCHSINTPLNTQLHIAEQVEGHAFRPGDVLAATRHVVRESTESRTHLQQYIGDEVDQYMQDQYWPDGMVRISGRELNGLVESACFERGELSCLSCHELHPAEEDSRSLEEWANDQLHERTHTNDACLQCHEATYAQQAHTQHAATSAGSLCYNCHMPYTTYGLLKAIRSHEITIPNVARDDVLSGRMNACNSCHLDKTAAWAATQLHERYAQPIPELSADMKQVASSVLWSLRGDAGQRALAAWSLGWEPALKASGTDWQIPFLAGLLEDPYDAVRFIAERSLRQLVPDLQYDYVGPPAARRATREQVTAQWHKEWLRSGRDAPQLLLSRDGPRTAEVIELFQRRDDRPVNLAE